MTSAQGSGARRALSPSSSGFSATWANGLHRVAAELVPERRVHLGREGLVLARSEAGEESQRDRGDRNGSLDRLVRGPAAFPRILDVAADLLQARVFLESPLEELEKPAADDR